MTTVAIAGSYAAAKACGHKRYWSVCKYHGETTFWASNRSCAECTDAERKKYQKRNAKALVVKRADWSRRNREKTMLQKARRRAKLLGLDYNLTPADIDIPKTCPALGVPLVYDGNPDHLPSLDRIDNKKGYVKGNVVVVSMLANRIKSNATIEELRKVALFYDQYTVG